MAFVLTAFMLALSCGAASSDTAKTARSRIFPHPDESPTLDKQRQQQQQAENVNFGFWHKHGDDHDDDWFDQQHPDDWMIPPVANKKRIVRRHPDGDGHDDDNHYDVVKPGYEYHYHSHEHTSGRRPRHGSSNTNNNKKKKSKKKDKKFHVTRKNVERACREIFQQVFPPQGFSSVQRLESIPFVTSDDVYYDDVSARLGPNCFDSLLDFSHQDLVDFLESSLGLNVSSSSAAPLPFSETINSDIYVAGTTCSFTKTFVQMHSSGSPSCHVEMDSFLVLQLDPVTGYLVKWMDFYDTREFAEKFTSCRADDTNVPTSTSLENDNDGETDDEVEVEVDDDDDSMQVNDDGHDEEAPQLTDDAENKNSTTTDDNSENDSVVEGPAAASAEEQTNEATIAISMTTAASSRLLLLSAGGGIGSDERRRRTLQQTKDFTNGTAVAADVAAQCRLIFETLFPPRQWTTLQDVQNFANLVAPQQQQQDDTAETQDDADDEPPYNYFAFPQGADYMTDVTWMQNFDPQSDLVDWFDTYWSPDVLEFGEYIVGNIQVADSQPCGAMGPLVCSMDKVLVAKFKYNDQCYVKMNSHLIMELIRDNNDDHNHGGGGYKMLRWVDYFDAQELVEKLSNCVAAWDTGTAAASTPHSWNSGKKKEFQILGMSLTSPTTLHSDAIVPNKSNSNDSRMSFVHFLAMVPLAVLAATAMYASKKKRPFLDDNNKSSLKLIHTDDSLPKHHHYGATSTEDEAVLNDGS